MFDRGYKPAVVEVGPFGFEKFTYKYDITFGSDDEDSYVSYKEYSVLTGTGTKLRHFSRFD